MDTPLHSDKLEDQCAVMNHADMLTEGLLRWCLKVAVIAHNAHMVGAHMVHSINAHIE